MTASKEPEPEVLGFRILTWIGIIEQLARTKANRSMNEIDLPWPQFQLLNHFSHRPKEGKTVTGIARAMQQLQPATTKTMKAMVKAGLLTVEPDKKDGRIKHHFLTEKGIERHREAVSRLAPQIQKLFDDWTPEQMKSLYDELDRLKVWLDDNR